MMMNTKIGVLLALVALGLLCAIGPAAADNTTSMQGMQYANDIQPYNGPIGPDSSLYGLKLAFENLDESFTFNQTERLEKEIDHSDTRIAELESALAANQTDAADRALDQYWYDINQTQQTLSQLNDTSSLPVFSTNYTGANYTPWSGGNYTGTGYTDRFNGTGYTPAPTDTGLIHAQQMILVHQNVLENLLSTHPGNPGLARAYNNSLDLEQRFEDKTRLQFDLHRDAENRLVFQPQLMNAAGQNRSFPAYPWNHTGTVPDRYVQGVWNQTWNQTQDNGANTGNGQYPGQVNQTWQDQHRQDVQENPDHGQYPSNGQGNRYGNSNGNDSGNANNNGYPNGNSYRDTRSHNQ